MDTSVTRHGSDVNAASMERVRKLRTFPRPDKLPDRIASVLEEEIRAQRMLPGDRLPTEHQLAAHFSVSRSVVREAVSRLRSAGLVDSRQGLGVFVTDAGPTFRLPPECIAKLKELHHIFELRIGVESEAAALAAANRTEGQLARIEEFLDVLRGALEAQEESALESGVEAEGKLYRSIAEASGNPYVVNFLEFLANSVIPRLGSVIRKNLQAVERGGDVFREHAAVVKAVRDKDVEKARRAARTHFIHSARRLAIRTTYLEPEFAQSVSVWKKAERS